jgi:hypothetical protein
LTDFLVRDERLYIRAHEPKTTSQSFLHSLYFLTVLWPSDGRIANSPSMIKTCRIFVSNRVTEYNNWMKDRSVLLDEAREMDTPLLISYCLLKRGATRDHVTPRQSRGKRVSNLLSQQQHRVNKSRGTTSSIRYHPQKLENKLFWFLL